MAALFWRITEYQLISIKIAGSLFLFLSFCCDSSGALPLFFENIILAPLKFHTFLAHASSCVEMICGYLDVWFIHLVCMKFTNFITLYHMVHIEDSVAWCLPVSCAVGKQYFFIRTISVTIEIRWSICGHSRLYCSESSSHVTYKFHQLVCISQPSWRVILWLPFTPCINISKWAVWLVSILSPSAMEKYRNVSAVLFNCRGKSLFIRHNTRFSWINLHFQTLLHFQGTLLQLLLKGKGEVVLCSV